MVIPRSLLLTLPSSAIQEVPLLGERGAPASNGKHDQIGGL